MSGLSTADIVILGGGPAGLAVARLLHLRGLSPRVLERDAGPHARSQGGSLDLGEHGGQLALREMGLGEKFEELARPLGQRLCLMDPDGTVRQVVDEGKASTGRRSTACSSGSFCSTRCRPARSPGALTSPGCRRCRTAGTA
ncbi:FAD-dependent oxidoreductase [Lentzea aerocolonigenes]|uniref:FAD-dependent oxidoreductase n=1 Tax=Lentzea aerocolonigenes TaxID=68170 RepID=UPI00069698F9|nr:FAD-dependent monooxygenase [Lentzea aerocolonigenes]